MQNIKHTLHVIKLWRITDKVLSVIEARIITIKDTSYKFELNILVSAYLFQCMKFVQLLLTFFLYWMPNMAQSASKLTPMTTDLQASEELFLSR